VARQVLTALVPAARQAMPVLGHLVPASRRAAAWPLVLPVSGSRPQVLGPSLRVMWQVTRERAWPVLRAPRQAPPAPALQPPTSAELAPQQARMAQWQGQVPGQALAPGQQRVAWPAVQ
jgi:hypothetical protein